MYVTIVSHLSVSICLSVWLALKLSNRDESGAWLAIVTRILFFCYYFHPFAIERVRGDFCAHIFHLSVSLSSLFIPLKGTTHKEFCFVFYFFIFWATEIVRYDSDLTPLTLWQNW